MKVNIQEYTDDGEDQVVEVQIDPWDTWSMDHTLAHIVLPMLVQLKETKHGAPAVDMIDVPSDLRCNDVESRAYWDKGEVDDKHFDRWDWALDEMIYAFDSKVNREELYMQFDPKTERELILKEQERISNGFRLFGKYYESLWD